MKNRELFHKDPLSWTLANQGVSSNNNTDPATLRYELETFVCDGEYRTGLVKMLQGYLDRLDKEQAGAWVSGFYGSGKSHLVKILRYLWTDEPVADGSTARSLASLPEEVSDLLKELSTRGRQGVGLHAAGGTLKAGKGDVRSRLLGIVFRSVGLPEDISVARLILDLRDEGKLSPVEEAIRAAGKDPMREFGRMYTSVTFQEAYLAQHPHNDDLKGVGAAVRAQYPPKPGEISIDEMLTLIRRALCHDGKLPCTVLVLDEVQQFINNDPAVTVDVQEVAEAVQKRLDGRVFLVATGQSALNDMPALQKIMGRFSIKTHLKDNDVEKVVRTVVLRKDPAKKSAVAAVANEHAGEISRQLKSTKIATRTEDYDAYVADYPLLPVRRRFWERVLHSIDPSGTAAQMRTQLRVCHEACRSVAEKPVGTVIAADFIYEQLATDLVISGEMQKRFQEIIEEQKDHPDGLLRSRVCALVFLINKLPREGADAGVRAHAEHLADLLSEDLANDPARLRSEIPRILAALVDEGVLMAIEGEYRIQTTEGAAWDSEFRRRLAAIKNNETAISTTRNKLLSDTVHAELASLSVPHGAAKVKRTVAVHYSTDAPSKTDGLIVWVRDGFTEPEGAVIQDIQKRSTDDATVHILVPKLKADELKAAIAGHTAADQTIHFKGTNPAGAEGKEALSAMRTRLETEDGKVEDCLGEILAGARLFLSGGQELSVLTLKEAVGQACEQVLSRLYPKFALADSPSWHVAWKKAKEGNSGALGFVGYNGDPDKHPVSAALLQYIGGGGKRGAEIYAEFTGGSYGWPKEAIDATLATLVVSGHLNARLNQQPAKLADLDQRKITQADYRVQHPVLTAAQKLGIRKLFKAAGHPFTPGDEAGAAPAFVAALKTLASQAGGDPPAPEKPHSPLITELEGLSGNDLLFRLHEEASSLGESIAKWRSLARSIGERVRDFQLCEQLLSFALSAGLAEADAPTASLQAVRDNRQLLDEPDPVGPVRKTLGEALRKALHDAHLRLSEIVAQQLALVEAHPAWQALPEAKRNSLIQDHGVASPPAPKTGTDEDLLAALRSRDIPAWRTLAEAMPTRCQQALAAAIREAEPKARPVQLPAATLKTEGQMEQWLGEARSRIQAALKDGPVIL